MDLLRLTVFLYCPALCRSSALIIWELAVSLDRYGRTRHHLAYLIWAFQLLIYFSNVTVSSENSGTNYCSGVIGRIRNGDIKQLSSVVVLGKTIFEGGSGFAITTGDSGAKRTDSVYYQTGSGNAYRSIGRSMSKEGMTKWVTLNFR